MSDPIKFQPGTVVATLGALQVATREQITELLSRHVRGDWGDMGDEDKKANESAKYGARILSSYEVAPDTKLWFITEWDRSATTVLTPDEY